jgi:anti-sigma regulatory factor (Ser/Thr protein kinase)
MTQPATDSDFEQLGLSVPNDADYVALARFAAGIVAARASFSMEELQDLQLAVDELYTSSGAARHGASASIDLERSGLEVRIALAVGPSPADSSLSQSSGPSPDEELSAHLLSALVDDHGSSVDERGASTFWLRKTHRP